jgi:hypothetical protein
MFLLCVRDVHNAHLQAGPYNQLLVRAAAEFNTNVSPLGLAYATKKSAVHGVLPDLVSQLATVAAIDDMPSAVIVILLNTITRCASAKEGYKLILTIPGMDICYFCDGYLFICGVLADVPAALLACIRHEDDGVVYAGFELLRRMCHNPRRQAEVDEETEASAKKILLNQDMRVAIIQALDVHSGSGGQSLRL